MTNVQNKFEVLTPKLKTKVPTPKPEFEDINGKEMTPLKSEKKTTPKTQEKVIQSPVKDLIAQDSKGTPKTEQKSRKMFIYRNKWCLFGQDCLYITKSKPNTGFPCDFAHSESELGQVAREVEKTFVSQSLYKTQPCWRGTECKYDGCTFAHVPEELNLRPCVQGGSCKNDKCVFAHPQVNIDKQIVFEMMKKEQKVPEVVSEEVQQVDCAHCEDDGCAQCELNEEEEEHQEFLEAVEEELTRINDEKEFEEWVQKCESEKSGVKLIGPGFACEIDDLDFPKEKIPEKKNFIFEVINLKWADITDEEDEEKERELLKEAEDEKKRWTPPPMPVPTNTPSPAKPTVITFAVQTQTQTQQKPKTVEVPTCKFYKTSMCRNGKKCTKTKCTYAHKKEELRPIQCENGAECENVSCDFFHPGDPIPTTERLYSDLKRREKKE
jgi:hypothetical protein